MKIRKQRIIFGISLGVIVVIILFILFLIHICSSQAESKADQQELDKQELVTSEEETEKEEITEKIEEKEPVEDKKEEPVAEQKEKVLEQKVIMFEVDSKKRWQDCGIVVAPEMKITISYQQGKWRGGPEFALVDAGGYPFIGMQVEYSDINFGSLVAKVGNNNVFKVGNYYEIDGSLMSGKLCFRINDENEDLKDNCGSITVEISIQ